MKQPYFASPRRLLAIGAWVCGYVMLMGGLAGCHAPDAPGEGLLTTSLDSFGATLEQPPLGVATVFSWSVLGRALVCELDTNSDGQPEYVIRSCTSASRIAHTYTATGNHLARLKVTGEDGQTREKSLAVAVGAANRAPAIQQFQLSRGLTANTLRITWTVQDPDGQSLRCRIDTNGDGRWEADLLCNGTNPVTPQNSWSHSVELPLAPGRYTLTFEVSDAYSVTTRQQTINLPLDTDQNGLIGRFSATPGPRQTLKVEIDLRDPSGSLRCLLTVESLGQFNYPRCQQVTRLLRFSRAGTFGLKLEVFDGAALLASQELNSQVGNDPLGFFLRLYTPYATPVPVDPDGSIEFDDIIDVEDTGLRPRLANNFQRFIDQLDLRYHLVYNSSSAPAVPICLDLDWYAAWGQLSRSQLFVTSNALFQVPLQFIQTAPGRWESQGVFQFDRQDLELLRFEHWYYARPFEGSPATVGGRGTLADCGISGPHDYSGTLQLIRFDVLASERQAAEVSLSNLSAGTQHTCALASPGLGGKPFCWGENANGQSGLADPAPALVPHKVQGNPNVPEQGSGVAMAAGGLFSCGLASSGAALCWGDNSTGQLGTGDYTSTSLPQLVQQGGVAFTALEVGFNFACALTGTGQAYCWGNNSYGQLGLGNSYTQAYPQPVTGSQSFTRIALGSAHACGINSVGLAYCWGQNSSGQLAVTSSGNVSVPEAVLGNVIFQQITAGNGHTCGLSTTGVAQCWGINSYGQAGSGNTYPVQGYPTPVVGTLTFTQLAAGDEFTCGLAAGGVAYCWGKNSSGQLGTGNTVDQAQPRLVQTALRFTSLTAGGQHACATTSAGKAYCWGDHSRGQLGTREPVDAYSNVPVPVALPLQQ